MVRPPSFSQQRRTKNELLIQDRNTALAETVLVIAPTDAGPQLPLQFYCECSDLSCTKRIELPIQDYQRMTEDEAHFVVLPGHEQSDIETIAASQPDYSIVQKYQGPLKAAQEL